MSKSQRPDWLIFLFFMIAGNYCFSQGNTIFRNSTARYVSGYKTIALNANGDEIQRNFRAENITEFDIWYPATSPRRGRPLKIEFFTRQHGNRLKKTIPVGNWNGFTGELEQLLLSQNQANDPVDLGGFETKSFKNAPLGGTYFPLILYYTSDYNLSFENISLFEYLSSRGFLIAVVRPGSYKHDQKSADDIIAEINNSRLVLQHLQNRRLIDSSRTVAMGWQKGGLTAFFSALLIDEIKALISLDGSELQYYGDKFSNYTAYETLKGLPAFQAERLGIPYLYLGSDRETQFLLNMDSIYNPIAKISGASYYLRFKSKSERQLSPIFNFGTENATNDFRAFSQNLVLGFLKHSLKDELSLFTENLENYIIENGSDLKLYLPQTIYDSYEIRGRVIDTDNETPIAFSKIQIPKYDLGVLADDSGGFKLNYLEKHQNGKLKVTAPGYETKELNLLETQELPDEAVLIKLKKVERDLNTITEVSQTENLVPGGTPSDFFAVSPLNKLKGFEWAAKVKLSGNPGYVGNIKINLNANSADKIILRPHIYRIEGGMPGREISTENLLIIVQNNTLVGEVDIESSILLTEGDIIVSLELIDIIGDHNDIAFKSIFPSQNAFVKNTWNTDWTQYTGPIPAIELILNYANDEEQEN